MKLRALTALLALVALVAAGCGGADDTAGGGSSSSSAAGASGKSQLSLVAYSTPQVVYDEVIPGFRRTTAGAGVTFKESFGASGDQSRAV
ncbi:MAG: sulfate/thiosulfate transport system substrate-binding protein, partial [Solirubrobacteraceae bacterium]|nr:sulfate/thiosulfate transport system substrate-binding protein [Solirubrobacteraceae bacterium]